MTTKETRLKRDKKKTERLKKIAKQQAIESAKKAEQTPMNKHFINAVDENGNKKYPLANLIMNYKMYCAERVEDIMREISAYMVNIVHRKNRLKALYEQLDGDIYYKNEHGKVLTKSELEEDILTEKVNIPRDLLQIRERIVDKLLPMIDEVRFTGEQYNVYVTLVKKKIEDLGYVLFPEKLELIFPEI